MSLFHLFIDEGFRPLYATFEPPLLIGIVLISVTVVLALVWLIRATPRPVHLFVITLSLVPFISLGVPDLVFGNLCSIVMRYLTPTYLAVQLALACTLAGGLQLKHSSRYLWHAVLVLLLVGGLVSSVNLVGAEQIRSKGTAYRLPNIAGKVHQHIRPLVLINADQTPVYTLLAFCQLLPAHTRIHFVNERDPFTIPRADSDVLLFAPSQALVQRLIAQGERPRNIAHDVLYLLFKIELDR